MIEMTFIVREFSESKAPHHVDLWQSSSKLCSQEQSLTPGSGPGLVHRELVGLIHIHIGKLQLKQVFIFNL